MAATALTVPYAGPTAGQPLALLAIEQEPWSVYTGAITKGEMVRWLAAMVAGDDYQSRIDCGIAGDQLVCTLHAYPYRAGLEYRLLASWGTLSDRQVEMLDIEELVQFRLTTTERTDHPVRRILSVSWDDDCYGPAGEIVVPPPLTADGEEVACGSPVYGTARVRYLCERHSYVLNAPRREDAIAHHFSAVVVGVYDGGLAVLGVEPPPGIEAFEADPDAVCGRSWIFDGSVTFPDDEPITASPASRETVMDYCKQTVISDRYQ